MKMVLSDFYRVATANIFVFDIFTSAAFISQ